LMRKRVTCLIMAGGKGSRYGSPSKIVVNVCGEVLIRRVVNNARPLCKNIILALSKYTSNLTTIVGLCKEEGINCLETSGEDFVKDLILLVNSLPKPLLVISGDVVTREHTLMDFLTKALEVNKDVVTMTIVREGNEEPVGISLFKNCGGSWTNVTYDLKDVIDIDAANDLELARSLCKG